MRIEEDLRLWAKIDIGDCWEWTGCVQSGGYGQVRRDGAAQYVHRYVWARLVGPIPAGLQLDHMCRNRKCCNPDHLEPVTQRENTLRGIGPTSVNAAKTVCIRGHDLDAENTYVRPNGYRMCRECAKGGGAHV